MSTTNKPVLLSDFAKMQGLTYGAILSMIRDGRRSLSGNIKKLKAKKTTAGLAVSEEDWMEFNQELQE